MIQQRVAVFLIILFSLQVYAPLDLYMPSLPHIAHDFRVGHTAVQLTVTWCLLGLGVIQLFCGFLMDCFGRRRIILIGFLLAMLGALIVIFAPTVSVINLGRFIQGCASGILLASARVMILDCFEGRAMYHAAAWIGISIGITHAVAPWIGGYLQQYTHWKVNFGVLFFIAVASFLYVFFVFKETRVFKTVFSLSSILASYRAILSQKAFWGGDLILALSLSMSMVFNFFMSFLLQKKMHYSAVAFGYCLLLISLCYFLGALLTKKLLRWIEPHRMIQGSLLSMMFFSSVMLVFSLYGILNIYLVMLPTCFIAMSCGMAIPNVTALSLSFFKTHAGVSSSSMGAFSGIMAAIMTITLTGFKPVTLLPLAGYLFLASLLMGVFYYFLLLKIFSVLKKTKS
ncbi:MAG: hypothetical protein A3F10_02325 [Coxiella sp. RIFCSPHIGHO2_12_FULL_42_15]|nr:MAG: hypothetical protein A3F10_02325 [Coxiella sp. RIFCSPHIGHO2_12_FULL_42_15]